MSEKLRIIVDADACPVKREITKVARQMHVEVWMVASYDHVLQAEEGVNIVQVDRSDQSADLHIANHIQERDILITQDYGLAAIGLSKRAVVISGRGQLYHQDEIESMLEQRHQAAKLRRGGKYTKGPKPFTATDRKSFLHTLTKVLKSLQENSQS